MEANSIRDTLKSWIDLDDEERRLRGEIKKLGTRKTDMSKSILTFMRENSLEEFAIDGSGAGTISRSVRNAPRPPIKRANMRTQLYTFFADQPQKVTDFLRQLEGPTESTENKSAPVGKQKELLVRRIPKEKNAAVPGSTE